MATPPVPNHSPLSSPHARPGIIILLLTMIGSGMPSLAQSPTVVEPGFRVEEYTGCTAHLHNEFLFVIPQATICYTSWHSVLPESVEECKMVTAITGARAGSCSLFRRDCSARPVTEMRAPS